jgi:aflatoxin B1 aldehyde reductase
MVMEVASPRANLAMYRKPTVESAVDRELWSLRVMGYRGILQICISQYYRKYGDGVIIWASSVEQLRQNLDIIAEGPLPQEVAAAIGKIYRGIADDRIPYHF